jgi:CBS domain containing-hemolysin-like protein
MNRVTTTGRGGSHTLAPTKAPRGFMAAASLTAILLAPGTAAASFLSGEALDTAANVLAWVVIVIVPVVGIAVFWMVHVLPEKIAHKRHHPQRQAIQTLCLLSLVFGGLLWPIAWLWAYTRPVAYKLAYGTEKHEDYFQEIQERLAAGQLTDEELRQLRSELDAMHVRGALPAGLQSMRDAAAAAPAAARPGSA